MAIADIVEKYPVCIEIMLRYGLHCVGCHVAADESLEQGAKGHGMDDEQIEEMLDDMNEKILSEQEENYNEFSTNGDEEE